MGYILGQENPSEEWDSKYEGPMWGNCAVGYSKVSDFEWQKWPDKVANAFKYIGFLLLMIVIIVILIITTIRGTSKKKGELSVLYKIFISHWQLLSIIYSFNLNWKTEFLGVFNTAKTAGDSYEQFVSFDWLIDQRSQDEGSRNGLSLYYYRVILSFIGPFIVIVWWAIATLIYVKIVSKNDKNNIKVIPLNNSYSDLTQLNMTKYKEDSKTFDGKYDVSKIIFKSNFILSLSCIN